MKTTITLTAMLLLLSVPTEAQEDPKLYFLVNAGLSTPNAPDAFENTWKDGTSIGGGIGYRISPRLAIQGLVNYDSFEFDGQKILAEFDLGSLPGVDVNVSGADTSVLSLSAELKAALRADPNKASPYVAIGAGVADVDVSDTVISMSFFGFEMAETMPGMSETAATATLAGGVDIPLKGRYGAFIEGRYQANFTEGDSLDFGSVRTGVRIRR
jgi:opacity protein-like surface antigen